MATPKNGGSGNGQSHPVSSWNINWDIMPDWGSVKALVSESKKPAGLMFDWNSGKQIGMAHNNNPTEVSAGVIISDTEWLEYVLAKDSLSRWVVFERRGQLGFPDRTKTKATSHQAATMDGVASLASLAIAMAIGSKQWRLCPNFKAEHADEVMQVARLRRRKGKVGQPDFVDIAYPQPYHLAKYFEVTTHFALTSDKKIHVFKDKNPHKAATERIDYQIQNNYELLSNSQYQVAQSAKQTAVNLKLAEHPMQAGSEDFYGLLVQYQMRGDGTDAIFEFSIDAYAHKDQRLLALMQSLQPIDASRLISPEQQSEPPLVGVLYPETTGVNSTGSSEMRLVVRGKFSRAAKLVGGATLRPMKVHRSIAELMAKPEQPKPGRYFELEE